jgi:hypothetical protein
MSVNLIPVTCIWLVICGAAKLNCARFVNERRTLKQDVNTHDPRTSSYYFMSNLGPNSSALRQQDTNKYSRSTDIVSFYIGPNLSLGRRQKKLQVATSCFADPSLAYSNPSWRYRLTPSVSGLWPKWQVAPLYVVSTVMNELGTINSNDAVIMM